MGSFTAEPVVTPSQVFLFGDQSTSFLAGLQQLLLKRNNPFLESFIDRVHIALRREIQQLPATERRKFPQFCSAQDLLTRVKKGETNTALESALSTFYQLCCFINYYGSTGQKYPTGENQYVAGLCVGSLAAAAVSSSETLSDLIPTGIDAIRVALRVGLRVGRATTFLDTNNTPNPLSSWTYVIPETTLPRSSAEETLLGFTIRNGIPRISAPYISAFGHRSITISGHPQIVKSFVQSLGPNAKVVPVAIYAPYHAPHIYTEEDVEQVLAEVGDVSDAKSNIPVISSSTGDILESSTFSAQLRRAVENMLLLPLDLTRVSQTIAEKVPYQSPGSSIVPIATTIAGSLIGAIEPSAPGNVTISNSIMEALQDKPAVKPVDSGRAHDSKIAIVGMSGRFPEAADIEAFWNVLYQGLDVHRRIPEDRFNADMYCDPTGKRKNTSKVMNGCWINEPGLFDPKFFNISPKEAEQSDPSQRLALQTAYEALEMAGIVPDRTPSTRRERVGVFYGMTSDDWREVNSGQNIDTYFIPGGNRAFTPGRLNYYFKFSGPSVSVDTACSSSLAAIHIACNSLWRNDCDTAIAGGTNVMTNPDNFAGLDRGHFLSRTGNCNTFDDAADGYCRADGVGTIILKRMEDALADKDPILGVIMGAYTNHSAESVSITRPHAGAQEYIFSKLLSESGVHPHDVSYIEMHGTGTQAGDATEMASVLNAFAPDLSRSPQKSLHLGSAKSNVGHGESASGVVALIKVLLMMQKNMIPPHCGIKGRINSKFPTDMTDRNVHIARAPTAWNRPSEQDRRVFVNNFSAAGGNTALLVGDAPRASPAGKADARTNHVIALSAKAVSSLKDNIKNLKTYIQANIHDETLLSKLSYTTTARRMHHQFRYSITADSIGNLLQSLDAAAQRDDFKRIRAVTSPVGFVFSGQGAQYTGMGRHLFEHNSGFRADIMEYDTMARKLGFPSILSLIDGSVEVETLDPLVIQLGTACLQMALASLWRSFGIEPAFVIGHSLGHYAALNVAGVLTASDTIYLTGTRARLLQEKCQMGSHAMLAVRASLDVIQSFLDAKLHEVACVNGPKEIVISGEVEHIDQLAQTLNADNIKATRVNVPFAFHSTQVDPILGQLEQIAAGVTFHPPTIPVGSALLGRVVEAGEDDVFGPKYISRHCRESVNFTAALQDASKEKIIPGDMIWIELGPHTVCSTFLKSNLGQETVTVPSLRRNEDGWKILASTMSTLYSAGLSPAWDEYHRDFEACQEVLRLPAYSWDNKKYWINYVHDWCLTKGDAPVQVAAPKAQAPVIAFSTASVQKLLEEKANGSQVTILAESDFASEQLKEIAEGHRVNDTKLCTSSLYADIGLTLGKRILDKHRPDLKGYAVDVQNMNVDKPLIKKSDGEHLFRTEVKHDKSTNFAEMSIYSVNSQGKKTTAHAKCVLRFEDPKEWTQEWERNQYLIERSIEWLGKRAEQGFDSQLSTGIIYKLFSSLVDYSPGFKGLQEAILNSTDREATGRVKFQTKKGNFVCNPMWIDSCGQLTGFLMNGHEMTQKDQVFINHGWKSLKLAKEFREDGVYRTYIRMRNVEATKFSGDLYILEGDSIIGVYGGITFMGIARKVLNQFLPPAGAARQVEIQAPAPIISRGPEMDLPRPVGESPAGQLRPVLRILSEEIGLPLASLQDDLNFADYGVDSLMSLTITGRLREDLDIDIDSTVFTGFATIGDLVNFLGVNSSPADTSSSSSVSDSVASSALTSPEDSDPPSRDHGVSDDLLSKSIVILGEEIGVSSEEIIKAGDLTELGMDSLLSLTVLGRLREELDLDLDADFFIVNSSFDSIRASLQPSGTVPKFEKSSDELVQEALSQYRATSTLLQGSPKNAKNVLFLFPDGSGSATSYAALNAIGPDVAVYGLNCPWLKTAENLVTYGIAALAALYLKEIRRRQPQGPYNFGGWSAGGICAYEAAIQVTRQGESVQRLILLDSPRPIGLEKLPPRLFDFFNSMGMFGDENGRTTAPDWLLGHFLGFIEALDMYKPIPWHTAIGASDFAQAPPPQTHILWAEDGVCKNPTDPRPDYRDDDPREMKWLCENRTSFGPNGWDMLVGEQQIAIQRIQNANHFTMLTRGKNTERVVEFLKSTFVA
ncbi:Polyketide synthase 1 [Cladobotryum mycophilum]|uniref:Polyketide synthase 1 n=1 Tax=Cladobotryum mycophilum TaxID=491253 RepID=A0ABR0S9B6_9HYPO